MQSKDRGVYGVRWQDLRKIMARVAAILHQPLADLEGMTLDELLAWGREARQLAGELAALAGR